MGELTVVANLYRSDEQNYEIRVRWVLGENGSNGAPSDSKLPAKGDEFLTTIQTRSGAYLQPDLTWGPDGGAAHEFSVKPMLDAMLDPPRKPKEVEGQNGRFLRRIADKPTAGVADDDLKPVDLGEGQGVGMRLEAGKGLGVRHLLNEADKAKNFRDTSKLIEKALLSAERALRVEQGGDALQFDQDIAKTAAGGLADLLVSSGARPQEFIEEFARLHNALVSSATDPNALQKTTEAFVEDIAREAGLISALGFTKSRSKAEIFSTAALAMSIFSDEAFLKSVERTSFDAEQVRRQLKLKALQGGTLVDFWAQSGDPIADDSLRGDIYPAFQMLGLGMDLPKVPTATIDAVTSGPGNGFIQIKTRAASRAYGTGKTLLLPGDIARAQTDGQAFRPTPPRAAAVNYDLLRKDPPSTTHANGKMRKIDADEPGFTTGNGAIEIHITPAFARYQERDDAGELVPNGAKVATETAFNVYAVWEGADGMDSLFSDTSNTPSLEEIRPYLVTRRYSYNRDLHGAFPDINGAPHPKLATLLTSPPWEAILKRAERVKDFNDYQASSSLRNGEDDVPTVPDDFYGGADGATIYSFDLRRGLGRSDVPPASLVAGWDPRAEVDPLWSPIKYRGQADNLDGPQGYRMFVTSVDSFDGESEPVPVRASDIDAGDPQNTYIFRPTYRTKVESPEKVELDSDGTKLTLKWVMPAQQQEYGMLSMLEAFEQAGHGLRGNIRIYRRRVVADQDEDAARDGPVSEAAEDLHWRGVNADFLRRGWQRAKQLDQTVDVPILGGEATLDIPLTYADRGYEYAVGLSVAVPKQAANFWSAPAEARRVYALKRVEDTTDEFELEQLTIVDTPAHSSAGVSDPIAVPNIDTPRAPEVLEPADTMAFADPVIPIPGVQRDPILARIATLPNSASEGAVPTGSPARHDDPENRPIPTWQDTDFVLNPGQVASAEGALRRTLPSLKAILGRKDLAIDAPELSVPRRLLAQSFLRFAEVAQKPDLDANLKPEIGLHPSIGFRGILQLQWGYVPHLRREPIADDAEATSFDIYQAIIPNGEDATRARARSVLPPDVAPSGSARRTADGYEVKLTLGTDPSDEVEQLLGRLQEGRQPICGLFEKAGDASMTPFHVDAAALNGDALNLRARKVVETLGDGSGTVYLFFATQVTKVPTVDLDEPGRPGTAIKQNVLLPVPGGESEFGFWYIMPRSGANRLGAVDRTLVVFRQLSDTIEPTAPNLVEVAPPFDRSTTALDPKNLLHAPFLPSDIADAEDGRSNPRLLLTWQPPDDGNLSAVIYRQEERLDQDAKSLRVRDDSRYQQWRDIDEIRGLPEGSILNPNLLTHLSDPETGWLAGKEVETEPGSLSPQTPFIGPEKALSARSGLDVIANRGSYIDYRQTVENDNEKDAMDANMRYRYQLRYARKLPTQQKRNVLESEPLYLTSPASTWTPWMVPETPPIETRQSFSTPTIVPEAFNPEVEFRFSVGTASWAGSRLLQTKNAEDEELDWNYRIVIRRKMSVISPSATGSETVENDKEVGLALTINPKRAGEEFSVTDRRIERSFADEDLSLDYDIFIQQYALRRTGASFVEQPVRSHEETPTLTVRNLAIPAPNGSSDDVEEMGRIVKVTIL